MSLNLNIEKRLLGRLKKLPTKDQGTIKEKLDEFQRTGRGDIKKLREDLFRLRAGRWRIFFYRKGDDVYVLEILSRDIAYRLEVIDEMIRKIARLKARS